MVFHLAQLNVARLNQPLDHADSVEFVDELDPVNALAESSPGFLWRLTDDTDQSSSYVRLPGEVDPLVIVNYSIWESLDALRDFVFKSGHVDYLRRRCEWFEKPTEPTTVLWWTPAGIKSPIRSRGSLCGSPRAALERAPCRRMHR